MNELQMLTSLESTIYGLNEENFETSAQSIINLFDSSLPLTFDILLCKLIYITFVIRKSDPNLYIKFICYIDKQIQNDITIIEVFANYLCNIFSQESYCLYEQMIEQGLVQYEFDFNGYQRLSYYFAHHLTIEETFKISQVIPLPFQYQFLANINELSKDNWKLHKQLIKEGVNTNEIAKIIRNDEIEKFQNISTQAKFNFNQTIEPSLYERCDFINHENVTLIDYAAFFGSIQCFKYLLINGANIADTLKYAIVGGNIEIIHLCENNKASYKKAYKTAIKFRKNNIFHYFYDKKIHDLEDIIQSDDVSNKNEMLDEMLKKICIKYNNYEIFSFLMQNKNINVNILKEIAYLGNTYLLKYFIENKKMYKNLLFKAIESGNIETIKFILQIEEVDINERDAVLTDFINLEFIIFIIYTTYESYPNTFY